MKQTMNRRVNDRWWFPAVLLIIGLSACATRGSGPEAVLEEYLQLVYSGQIEKAQALCTPAGRQHLEALRGVIFSSESSPDTSRVEILSLLCQVEADTALCNTRINDGYANINNRYYLLRSAEGWRVDQRPLGGNVRRSTEDGSQRQ